MSAVFAPLERSEVFWFFAPMGRAHAFELVEGEIEPTSVCGKVDIDVCEDEPVRERHERHGVSCLFCLAWGAT